jgi:glucokinase
MALERASPGSRYVLERQRCEEELRAGDIDMSDLWLGVDIGGTKIRVGVVTSAHQVLDVREAPTPVREGAGAVLEVVARLGRELRGRWIDVAACGVGTAGVVDPAGGTVVASTDTLLGWVGTPVVGELTTLLGLRVHVDNDVNAFALGEVAAGAARGQAHVLAVMVGTGIGGAILLDGRLWRGAHHNAGEVGHVPVPGFGDRRCTCGGNGHLESVAAGPAMAARYHQRSGDAVSFAEVARRAEARDGLAAEVVDEGGRVLGQLLAGLTNAIDPETVVVGGGAAQPGGRYWSAAERHYRQHLLPAVGDVPLRPGRLGRDAVLIGAAELARRSISVRRS